MWKNRFRVAVLTASDKGFQGLREDLSGPLIAKRLAETGCEIVDSAILPDEEKMLSQKMQHLSENGFADLILTTGGTGLSPRDCTPEATLAIADRIAPGISEAIRAKSLEITPKAMLSRAVSVVRGNTLIINLPGSPKAVDESLDVILPVLEHALDILCNKDSNCAR